MPMNYPSAGEQAVEDILREGVPEVDTEQLFSNSIPASYVVYKRNGTVYADAQRSDLTSYSDPDAATVINNAIESLPAPSADVREGRIVIKRGEYTISSTIKLYGHTRISGEGIGFGGNLTVLKAEDGLNDNVLQYGPPSNETMYFAWVDDMGINGNSANQTAGNCLEGKATDSLRTRDLYLHRVSMSGGYDNGVLTNNTHGWHVTDCIFESCNGPGFNVDGSTGGCEELQITNSAAIGNSGDGFFIAADRSQVRVFANNNDGIGVNFGWNSGVGDNSTLKAVSSNNGSDGVRIRGYRNYVKAVVVGNGGYGIRQAAGNQNVTDYIANDNTSGPLTGETDDANLFNGLGFNGANDPSAGGVWNGVGWEGVKVLWNDGTNYYISTYYGGTWYDVQVDSPTV